MATTKLMTAEDLWEMQEPGRYDLIRGELIQMPPAGGEHSEIGVNILWVLWSHVRESRVGRVYGPDAGFILAHDPAVVLSPHIAFVRSERIPPLAERIRFLDLAPDLAVEIVSPSDRSSDVDAKVIEYLRAGTQLVLVVQPRTRTVTAYAPDHTARVYSDDDEIDIAAVVPDFRISVAEIFQ